jgi:hypothetical protein
MLSAGWVYSTLCRRAARPAHLVIGMVKSSTLRNALLGRQFDLIKGDTLSDEFNRLSPALRRAARRNGRPSLGPGEASEAMAPAQMGNRRPETSRQPDRGAQGQIDPVSGWTKIARSSTS